MDVVAQISAVLGISILVVGLTWLYVRVSGDDYHVLYVLEFVVLLPVFAFRHWRDEPAPLATITVGLILTVAGYAHGW